MSEFRLSMKFFNLSLTALAIYIAAEGSQKIKTEGIDNKDIQIDKSYIVGASITISVIGFLNFVLLTYLYDATSSFNLMYKSFGLLSSGALGIIGGFLLAQFIEINYSKKNNSGIFTKDRFPDDIEIVGLVLGGLSVGVALLMILQILLTWGKSKKKVRR